jgi:hypothetical protein
MAAMPANAGAAALRTFFNIVEEKWSLSGEEARTLLGAAESSYYRWKQAPEKAHLSKDTFERLSYVFGIYKALHLIYGDPGLADSWLKRANSNPLFNERPPLSRLLGGQVADLFLVRQHLDARRGVWV